MSIQVEYDNVNECVIGRFEGDLNINSIDDYRKEIEKVAKQKCCFKFLNDLRGANIKFSIIDFYDTPKKTLDSTFDRRWKRAVLLKPNSVPNKDRNFFETVNINRGIRVKTFTEMAEALNWLRSSLF